MVKILPFKAVRPARDKAHLFASRSYLSYSDKTIKEKIKNNPFTFLQIINPDYNNKKNLEVNIQTIRDDITPLFSKNSSEQIMIFAHFPGCIFPISSLIIKIDAGVSVNAL